MAPGSPSFRLVLRHRANCSALAALSRCYNGATSGEEWLLESLDLARQVAELVAERKAEEVLVLDIRSSTVIADYFVICSGTSERQLRALTEEVRETLDGLGVRALRVEGLPRSGWVLIDYGSVIVHLFSPAERDYYRLERLWARATPILRLE